MKASEQESLFQQTTTILVVAVKPDPRAARGLRFSSSENGRRISSVKYSRGGKRQTAYLFVKSFDNLTVLSQKSPDSG